MKKIFEVFDEFVLEKDKLETYFEIIHKYNKHNTPKHICDICGKSFSTNSNMNKHKKKLIEAIIDICNIENNSLVKIKFISAAYDLSIGKDYTNGFLKAKESGDNIF